MLNGFAAIEQIRQGGASFLVVVWHGFLLDKNQDQTSNSQPESDRHSSNIKTSVTLHRRAFRLEAYIAGATHLAAALAPGRRWAHGLAQGTAATEPATSRAKVVGIKGGWIKRSRSAMGALYASA